MKHESRYRPDPVVPSEEEKKRAKRAIKRAKREREIWKQQALRSQSEREKRNQACEPAASANGSSQVGSRAAAEDDELTLITCCKCGCKFAAEEAVGTAQHVFCSSMCLGAFFYKMRAKPSWIRIRVRRQLANRSFQPGRCLFCCERLPEPKPGQRGRKKEFCSPACRQLFYNHSKKDTRHAQPQCCIACGERLPEPKPGQRGRKRKFCSAECRNQASPLPAPKQNARDKARFDQN